MTRLKPYIIIVAVALLALGSFFLIAHLIQSSVNAPTYSDREDDLRAAKYREQYPITDILPFIYAHYDKEYHYTEFRIDGGSFENCPTDFCLKITDYTNTGLDQIKSIMSEKGHDLSRYHILSN